MTHEYVGQEFSWRPTWKKSPVRWSHGVCVSVTTTARGRISWIRLRFPDHTERSFRPADLLHIIPYRGN